MSAEIKFDTKSIGILELLKNYKFKVPLFQRPYAWTQNETEDFWNDLIAIEDEYLLGAVVFNKVSNGFLEIIDGQQRLATVTIFTAVLRDLFYEYSFQELGNILHDKFISTKDLDGIEEFHLVLGSNIHQDFINDIQNKSNGDERDLSQVKPNSKEHKLVLKNYLFLKKKIEERLVNAETNEEKERILKDIRDLLTKIYVISIIVDTKETAYTIFETLNDRGLSLTIADLLKNLLFSKINSDENIRIALITWADIEKKLNERNIEISRFFRHFWLSKFNFITQKKLYKDIKKEITDYRENDLIDFLKDLNNECEIYIQLISPELGFWAQFDHTNRLYHLISGISVLRVEQCYSLLLNLIRSKKEGKINLSKLQSLVKFVEIFSFRYTSISKLSPSGLESIYSNAATVITKNHDQAIIVREIENFKNNLISKNPSRTAFIESLQNLSLDNKNKNLIKYILVKLNYDTPYDEEYANNISIEHVFPLTFNASEWEEDIEDNFKVLLGNLTILSPDGNREASNHSFERKKEIYRRSSLNLNNYFDSIEKWDVEQILIRHEALINEINGLWRLRR